MPDNDFKYNSVTLAKYIVAVANEKRLSINITKVQKLLYIAYGIFLAVKESRLTNERPQAWPYGPVFPTTRNKLLRVDLKTITKESDDFSDIKNDEEINSLMDLVFDTFGDWTASQLTEWSHADGTPWQKISDSDGFVWGDVIPDAYIMEYFKGMIDGED